MKSCIRARVYSCRKRRELIAALAAEGGFIPGGAARLPKTKCGPHKSADRISFEARLHLHKDDDHREQGEGLNEGQAKHQEQHDAGTRAGVAGERLSG